MCFFTSPLLILTLALAGSDLPIWGPTIVFNGGFGTANVDPFWTVSQSFDSITTSTAQAHSRAQFVQFSSTPGGQREVWLTHVFANPAQGDFSLWLYDFAAGQQALYELYALSSSSQPVWEAGLGTMDFDAFCFAVWVNGGGASANLSTELILRPRKGGRA